jgi:hypothetical protein
MKSANGGKMLFDDLEMAAHLNGHNIMKADSYLEKPFTHIKKNNLIMTFRKRIAFIPSVQWEV